MAKDLLSLLYGTTTTEVLAQAVVDLKEEKRLKAIRAAYSIKILWKEYHSHRSTPEKPIILKTPYAIESDLSLNTLEFDLAQAILKRYGITVSKIIN